DARFRCDVAGPNVFVQRAPHRVDDLRMEDVHHAPRPSSASLIFLSCASYSAFLRRIESTTFAGALLMNVSSESCRCELAISFSSCSFSFSKRERCAPV